MKNLQLFSPKYRTEEIFEHLRNCFNDGWTGLGFKTIEIETEWKNYTNLPNAHFINSNTSGLHLAIRILKDSNKWKEGDEIITTPLTFVSTNHSILYERLTPVFADVDDHLCLDVESIEKNITKKTKAVLYVGIGGNTGKFNEIVDLCQKHSLKLILDAAHMSGTFFKDKRNNILHSGHYADVSVFSFQSVKNLPTADSGMICFNNEDYDSLSRKLSWLGIDKSTFQRSNDKGNYKWEYDVIDLGYKYHGNSIMASLALVGLKYLESDNQIRREICDKYEKNLSKNGILTIKTHKDCVKPSRHLFQIIVENRNKFMELLNINGIYPGVHYQDNTKYEIYRESYGKCPKAHELSEKLISLPLHLKLSDEDVTYIIDKVIEINNKINL